jgi:hypothetical protein
VRGIQQRQAAGGGGGGGGGGGAELRERLVCRRTFKALAGMFGSMVTAAHLQDDMRVIHGVLQLAASFCRRPGERPAAARRSLGVGGMNARLLVTGLVRKRC